MTARTESLKRKAADQSGVPKKGKSVRDAWFDAVEADGFLESIYEDVLAKLKSKLGDDKVVEASKRSYSNFAHVLCDELCPGVVKVLDEDDSEEDVDEDEVDDDEEEEELSEDEEEAEIRAEEEAEAEMELDSDEDDEEEESEEEDEE